MSWLQVLDGRYLDILSRHKWISFLIVFDLLEPRKCLLHILIDQQANGHDILIFAIAYQFKQLGFHFFQSFEEIEHCLILLELLSRLAIVKDLVSKVYVTL